MAGLWPMPMPTCLTNAYALALGAWGRSLERGVWGLGKDPRAHKTQTPLPLPCALSCATL